MKRTISMSKREALRFTQSLDKAVKACKKRTQSDDKAVLQMLKSKISNAR